MTDQIISTRQRLINAAIELFAAQGVTETTTKAVAELAKVNEVTLFRHFGNKHGLLLAVISESLVFKELGDSLKLHANETASVYQALKDYCEDRLQALEKFPDLVRSLVGEAGNYPIENRQALGRSLTQANHYVAEYLATVMEREQLHIHLPAEKLASMLNSMLLGYAIIEFTSEFHELWQDRDEFLENLVALVLNKATNCSLLVRVDSSSTEKVRDLPANLVQTILQRAKKSGLRDYALMYVLFGTGLSTVEIVDLARSHQVSDRNQHLLQITTGSLRQVPVNQWIMGKRYGSYTRNPLTQWIKSRKDDCTALFLNDLGMPISEAEINEYWQILTDGLLTPEGQQPVVEQAQQTWCVEMLMKGMNLEDMSIITGWGLAKLQTYARRARQKSALEQAIRLDQKS
ncbi:TetR family transcriptional regulator [Aetokthonos hydrillicola Thurmond2011]|jgi:AcrR family transcriptional regulator|uniref:TetR family transcriptional regulator n=1 Tax=Aetokthonos hydrillicola Thurmond2011 TaxID=2712845 RepID=A0AAP5IAM4_9CYAN|nr:TetR family transcriptional regulator [Aetokthonos hydrillicola]MBO3463471.1 TetR family transcriptional regulator [Aetokthonos hydrillicola CCALA 1050]MBW4583730.1 TetR family transcriptional regulator [Aetokthonos hydrillicola CCALA 1050]MDR9895575.1 TetR family transcriptional regulator [Aetokthonos hydrillicola Thurmond2011]